MSNTIDGKTTPPLGKPVLGGDIGRINASTGKATPSGPTFGTVLASARPILKGAEAAASVLPGGPLLAAAVKAPTKMGAAGGAGAYGGPGGTTMTPRLSAGPGSSGMIAPGAGGVAMPAVSGATSGAAAPAVPGVDPTGEQGAGVESMLADSQAFNLYYLQLQEEMSAENRSYTTMSNVLKARHDTVKNAIGNIR